MNETGNSKDGINLRQYLTRSQRNQLILHGTMDAPDLDIRSGYPRTWEERVACAVKNRPHIAAKQIYPTSSDFACWYPVGLVVSDGRITSCSQLSNRLSNGDRVPILEKPEELEIPLEEKLESAEFYEVAIREPTFSALYLHDNQIHYRVVPRLSVESVKELAQSLGLPAIIFISVEELFAQVRQRGCPT
jgi:hypothetical protein